MAMSKREMEDLRPTVDTVMQKTFGFSDPTVIVAALNCVAKGMDKSRTVDMLRPLLEESAPKFVENLFDTISVDKSIKSSRKRTIKDEDISEARIKRSKHPSRFDDDDDPQDQVPSEPASLTTTRLLIYPQQIKEMMATARNQIIARKEQLGSLKGGGAKAPPVVDTSQQLMTDALEKAKRAAAIQARINASMANVGLAAGGLLGSLGRGTKVKTEAVEQETKPVGASAAATANLPGGPTPLILDDLGRTVDASGKAIQLTTRMPTLKANIRAKRRQEFKASQQEKPQDTVSDSSKFFDPRVSLLPAARQRRGFKFHDQGKFQQIASRIRAKSQLERLQSEIAQAAKKTGISSATKLALITPKKQLSEDEIPNVEWWDGVILPNDTYSDCRDTGAKFVGITHLVEHPIQMQAPAEPTKEVTLNIFLTQKERKKLRRQRRKEAQKEVQEKVRLGLEPPPEPKVRMANLMRVLGSEAVQDPTKVEAHVRAQMAKRQRTHEEANAARKLTKEQRREKKINKIKEDTSTGVQVAVYRLRNLQNQAKRFKVEANAKQLHMTGIAVLHKDVNVIVVEGGPKQQKKFKRLMLHRIKWDEDKAKKVQQVDSDDSDNESERLFNKCSLVWEGTTKQRSFSELKFKFCPTEPMAREQFRKHGVEQYWALSHSQSILDATEDT
ncbi:LOW QUALITY PROTEIN: U4/U6 small nuclear ribonucleoprotein Prp3-like [Amphiura filiformis]|uniref:LOW QUALITY PROTEIN: U4/U6 small nuclear ribonucleoprotein Prp3-like n=1 Tax=Amphiura filiformis TaxID=82378 RepID=UPI003B21D544